MSPSRKLPIVVIGAVVLTIAASLIFSSQDESTRFTTGQMPKCDSVAIRALLRKTIESAPRFKESGLKILRLTDFGDFQYSPTDPKIDDPNADYHFCASVIFTNVGKEALYFKISWMDAAKKTIWLETQ